MTRAPRCVHWIFLASAIVGAVAACDDGDRETDTLDSQSAALAPCSTVANTNVGRSLAVTDAGILDRFSFQRVLDQIRTTANVATSETSLGIYQRWMRTFGATAATGDCNDANIDPNDYGLVCPRRPELKLATVNPLAPAATVKFLPVGIFNRFDLAPTSGANCGEFRIVYAMDAPPAMGRAFVIFEAVLPNPTPSAGVAACLPVARFWQSLSADANVSSRAAKLERFYLTGGAVAGFGPVVSARNYGLTTNAREAARPGQIRTNFFIDSVEWQLREFKLERQCANASAASTCRLAFDHVPAKANPAEELFAGTRPLAPSFRGAFASQMPTLVGSNLSTIGMTFADSFNEFESISQRSNVEYARVESAVMRSVIQSKLSALGSSLTVDNVLARATTQTCAGCHEVSNNATLGGGKIWPPSNKFTHIDEGKNLSLALTGTFLPHRKAVLEKFINDRCAAVAASEAEVGRTVGGGLEGAAN